MHQPRDTSPESHRRYIAALRRMTPEQRLVTAATMNAEIRTLAEAGVRSRHPQFGPEEVREALAERLLGRELAREVRRRRLAAAR